MITLDSPQQISENQIGNYGLIEKQDALNTAKKLHTRLELRLYLIGRNTAIKSDYEKNEDEILKIETIAKMNRINNAIDKLEAEFIAIFKHLCSKQNKG